MRWLLYILICILVFLAPVERIDVAKLIPVEAAAVFRDNGKIVIQTDTKNSGEGESVEEALSDLAGNAVGVIYLDTMRYLLIGDGAQEDGRELLKRLKCNVTTGVYAGGDVKIEAEYLDAHEESEKPAVN